LINLNGGQATSVPQAPSIPNTILPDTEFVASRGWTSFPNKLETIVTRAPTHEPFVGHGQGANVSVNLNPITVEIPDSQSAAGQIYTQVEQRSITAPVTLSQVAAEPLAVAPAGPLSQPQVTVMTAQMAAEYSGRYGAYDNNGNLNPGWELDESNLPVYLGPELGSPSRGVGTYGQNVAALVASGLVNPAALNLIATGVSPDTVLKSAATWTGQFGTNSVNDYLSNKTLQNVVQVGLLIAAYTGLVDRGVLKGNEPPRYTATFVQPATTYGVDSVTQWIDGFADSAQVDELSTAARQGQYAIDFEEFYGEDLNLIDTVPTGPFEAQRDTIDQAVADIIGNPKVPVPQYTDIPAAVADVANTTSVLQPDGTIVRVPVTVVNTDENGIFRFAPGSQSS
jgi:hypothetical protein